MVILVQIGFFKKNSIFFGTSLLIALKAIWPLFTLEIPENGLVSLNRFQIQELSMVSEKEVVDDVAP